MFKRIMVPVDLAHAEKLQRSLAAAGDIAKLYDATLVYVGVTTSMPSALGHNPKEFEARLKAFAESESGNRGVKTESRMIISHDPATDLNQTLASAVHDVGADLVVMATHVPNLADHFMHAHGGELAAHTDVSIMLVRG